MGHSAGRKLVVEDRKGNHATRGCGNRRKYMPVAKGRNFDPVALGMQQRLYVRGPVVSHSIQRGNVEQSLNKWF